ncbi:MAG: DUF6597 domain-containing transcriptional factor, partial [Bryobacteraceae bacterium]
MRYSEFAPDERLARYVECFWTLEVGKTARDLRVLPDGCVDILFSCTKSGAIALSAVGVMTTARCFSLEPGDSFLGVRFRPAMAATFIADVNLLTD